MVEDGVVGEGRMMEPNCTRTHGVLEPPQESGRLW
jgi:hypothetical protein